MRETMISFGLWWTAFQAPALCSASWLRAEQKNTFQDFYRLVTMTDSFFDEGCQDPNKFLKIFFSFLQTGEGFELLQCAIGADDECALFKSRMESLHEKLKNLSDETRKDFLYQAHLIFQCGKRMGNSKNPHNFLQYRTLEARATARMCLCLLGDIPDTIAHRIESMRIFYNLVDSFRDAFADKKSDKIQVDPRVLRKEIVGQFKSLLIG